MALNRPQENSPEMKRPLWRDSWLMAICIGRIFMYMNYMVYAACLPIIKGEWGMSATQAGSIVSGFMIGYSASLAIASWLADHFGARRIFVLSAFASSVAALAFGIFARDYATTLLLYSLIGAAQGGIYTPGIVLMAERFSAARRGGAVGWFIASTSMGYAFSLAVSGLLIALGGYVLAFLGTGILPSAGALILWIALRRTPNVIHDRRRGIRLKAGAKNQRNTRYLVAGYTLHCWELLGMWAWIPAFLAASLALSGAASVRSAELAAYCVAAMHIVGAVASSTMGHLSDLLGRRAVLIGLGAAGALLSLIFGWLVAVPVQILVGLMLIYGFVVIGDSPVLSAALTEVVAPDRLGSVLAVRSLLGFGAGAVSPVAFGAVLDWLLVGDNRASAWGPAFMVFAIGGFGAAWCAWRLRRL
ncbi:MAG: MFS transporter [Proteobacteria bacterium]|nr:MFS transporter [Pseudomonadota bacterium]MBU2228226.1 MFS transporter [Pseudomonadota bacterium]MBU2262435.1 MFS transporter [Pseudomonadota bacterium]